MCLVLFSNTILTNVKLMNHRLDTLLSLFSNNVDHTISFDVSYNLHFFVMLSLHVLCCVVTSGKKVTKTNFTVQISSSKLKQFGIRRKSEKTKQTCILNMVDHHTSLLTSIWIVYNDNTIKYQQCYLLLNIIVIYLHCDEFDCINMVALYLQDELEVNFVPDYD